MGILQVMMAAAVIAIISAGMMMLADANRQTLKRETLKTNMQMLTESFQDRINDDRAWANTISDATNNPSMACILNGTDCSAFKNVYTNFVPKNVDGSFLIPGGTTASQGFSLNGVSCNTYSTTTPTDDCPFRYTFQWKPACPLAAVPCIKPNILINIVANHSPAKMLKINTTVTPTLDGSKALYSPNFLRGVPDLAKAQALCTNLGRTWDAVLYSCILPAAGNAASIDAITCNMPGTAYDAFLRPNGFCFCPIRCPIKFGESYIGAVSPSVYTIVVKCSCTTGSIQ